MDCILKKRCSFQTPILAALVCASVGVYGCAFFHEPRVLYISLFLSLLLFLWSHGVEAKNRFSLCHADRKLLPILGIGFGILSLSFLLGGIRSVGNGDDSWLSFLWSVLFLGLTVLEFFFLYKSRSQHSQRNYRILCRDLYTIGGVCVLLTVLNLEIFNAWIRWDSYDYYYYMSRLTPDLLTDLDSLRLANHAAYAVSLLYLIFNGIIGDPAATVYTLNLAMLIGGTILFWRIVRIHFPHWNAWSHLLISLTFSFSPFTFGLVYTVGLEWFLMFGILLFFWGDAEGLPVMQGFGMLLMCFSKETGVVLLFAIMAVRLLGSLYIRRHEPLLRRVELPLSLTALSFAAIWLVDLRTFSWLSSNQSSAENNTEGIQASFNKFEWNPTFVADRIRSLLFSNFTWLLLLILLAGALAYLLFRRSRPGHSTFLFVAQVLAALFAGFLTTILFVTYNHIRYAGPLVLMLLLLLPHAVNQIRSLPIRASLCGTLTVCFLLQCYFTVDPAMHLAFETIDKGNGRLAYSENNVISTEDAERSSLPISVNTQYNREILYFDQALDRLLRSISYDEETCLVFSAEYSQQSLGYRVYTEYLILGFGYAHTEEPRYLVWDEESETRTLTADDDQPRIEICYADTPWDIQRTFPHFERVVYIQMPFRDESFQDRLLEDFSWETIASEKYNGWEINAIEIKNVH
ncbi:MAG: hypothetical protein IJY47_03055 [Clostridia bacterium]|nr:hypothetical protein [Clostridia bacterium]